MPDLVAALREHKNLQDRLLEEFPELEEDAATLRDTLSGISSLDEQVVAAMRHAIEREAMSEGIALLIKRLLDRKRRLEEGAQRIRSICLNVMLEADLSRIRAADMSMSVGRGKPKVIITEPDIIPDHLCKIIREPSKSAIAIELNAGRVVTGAALGNPQPFLSVHRS